MVWLNVSLAIRVLKVLTHETTIVLVPFEYHSECLFQDAAWRLTLCLS